MKTNLAFQIFFMSICIYECKRTLFCFYTNWAQYRSNGAKFLPEDIDPQLCSHINYAFADLRNSVLSPFEWNDLDTEYSIGMYRRVAQLKNKNPELKVLLSVGGWNMGSQAFSAMVHDDNLRRTFVNSTIDYIRKNNFDGLDIDWEFPGIGFGSRPDDKIYFTKLLQELSVVFKPNNFLLTIAISASESIADTAYEAEEIYKYCDYMLLMAYDFHGPWNNFLGHNAPLYPRNKEQDFQRKLNIDYSVQYWLGKGTPRDKLVLGLATFGHSFELVDPKKNLPGDLARGPGDDGLYTRQPGVLSYFEICLLISKGYVRRFDNEQLVPYLVNDTEWISYDDEQSFREKVNYIKMNNLAGAMVWTLDFDNFNGLFCDEEVKYPLISLVKIGLGEASNGDTTIRSSTSTRPTTINTTTHSTTKPSTTQTTSSTISSTTTATTTVTTRTTTSSTSNTIQDTCKNGNGFYSDYTTNCKQYFVCEHIGTVFARIHTFKCPANTIFDMNLKSCNYAHAVKCQ